MASPGVPSHLNCHQPEPGRDAGLIKWTTRATDTCLLVLGVVGREEGSEGVRHGGEEQEGQEGREGGRSDEGGCRKESARVRGARVSLCRGRDSGGRGNIEGQRQEEEREGWDLDGSAEKFLSELCVTCTLVTEGTLLTELPSGLL